jgi:hypothetical protein
MTTRFSRPTVGRMLALTVVLLMAACSQQSAPTAPSPVASAKVGGGAAVTPALLDKVCHAKHADESSTVFSAVGPAGDVQRLVVTPSRKIADMGNLVFDMSGSLLGHDTGSEVPWDDRAFMEREHARVAALMGGAEIPQGSEPIRCK